MAVDKQFWLNLRVNASRVLESADQYRVACLHVLQQIEDEANIVARAMFGLDEWNEELLSDSETDVVQELLLLAAFASGKDRSIDVVYQQAMVDDRQAERSFSRLVLLYRRKQDWLKLIYLDHFMRQSGRPASYSMQGTILDGPTLSNQLVSEQAISSFPDNGIAGRYYVPFHAGVLGDTVVAAYRRQVSDRVVDDIRGSTRVRFAAFVVVEVCVLT